MPVDQNFKPKSPGWVLVTGSPFDGMTVIGTWDNIDQATEYAEKYIDDAWWVIEMEAM